MKIEETQFAIFQSANASVMDLYFYIGKVINDKIQWSVVRKSRTTANDGKGYNVIYYNFDMIVALAFVFAQI